MRLDLSWTQEKPGDIEVDRDGDILDFTGSVSQMDIKTAYRMAQAILAHVADYVRATECPPK